MTYTVAYSCPFVPAEWIRAHGLQPCRLVPQHCEAGAPVRIGAGMCAYMRGFVNAVLSDPGNKALVLTSTCDQMRRAKDLVAQASDLPVFLMNVPATWQTVAAQRLYVSELERLGRFLVDLGGNTPDTSQLRKTMTAYDERRAALRAAAGCLDAKAFSHAINEFGRTGQFVAPASGAVPPERGVSVALLGGPLPADAGSIFDLVEEAGGTIVLDATETGERTMPARFDRRRMKDDPVMVLAEAYFGTIPDPARRPNSGLYQWLKRECTVRGVAGILLLRHVWCDRWHAEVARLRDWLAVPLVDVELGDNGRPGPGTRTCVQALIEAVG